MYVSVCAGSQVSALQKLTESIDMHWVWSGLVKPKKPSRFRWGFHLGWMNKTRQAATAQRHFVPYRLDLDTSLSSITTTTTTTV